MFGPTLFGGSRFLFWSLSPFLLLFALVTALLVPDWTSLRGLLAAVLIAAALLLTLQLYDGTRFHWAGRVLAGIVFSAYVAYLIEELVTEGMASLSPRSSGASAFKAVLGLLIIGIPAALYAFSGRWTARRRRSSLH
jgi:H+/Cl- antiporter ClcA